MSHSQFSLLATKRFCPLFVTQFFGAFNDNLFKNAFIILLTYTISTRLGWKADIGVQVISILFILPFLLFSAMAGQLADGFEKTKIIKSVKFAEIGIMLLASWGFISESPWPLFAATFLMGVHSTFFGPIKYSLLPEHLKKEELISGNALIEAGTYLAILGGTILGSKVIVMENGGWLVSGFTLLAGLVGLTACFGIPKAEPLQHNIPIRWNIFKESWALVQSSQKYPRAFRAILGISWFWSVGCIWLTIIPPLVKDQMQMDAGVSAAFVTLFAVGIGIGSLICETLLKGEVSAKYAPLAGIGMSLFTVDFVWAVSSIDPGTFTFTSFSGVRIAFDLVMIAIGGGVFSVPLYAVLQVASPKDQCSRNIAANNIVNALFIIAGAVLFAGLSHFDWSIGARLLLLSALNVVISIYIVVLVPESFLHTVVRRFFKIFYRVEIRGLESLDGAEGSRIIIPNHTSFLDAVLLAAILPKRPVFAINTHIARQWWVKPALWAVSVFPLDPTRPMSIKTLIARAKAGEWVVIFPEGRLTVTGTVMKVYEGPGVIAVKTGAPLIPVRIRGLERSRFSAMGEKANRKWFPKVTVDILPACRVEKDPVARGRAARRRMASTLYKIMTEAAVQAAPAPTPLFDALIESSEIHGKNFPVLEDVSMDRWSYRRLIASSLVLGPNLTQGTQAGDSVGVLLPNAAPTVAVIFGLQSERRVPALLNFSAGSESVLAACRAAKVSIVWTSDRFITMGKLEPLISALVGAGIEIRKLETLKQNQNITDRVRYIIASLNPRWIKPQHDEKTARALAEEPAVILFTSGSSGTPKGVALSHRNLQTNRQQLLARLDFHRQDKIFNALPLFHAFGLTAGTLVPLLSGVRVFLYPSPLHYGAVPEMVYNIDATMMFGTDTFLAGYARKAHAYDFFSVRYVFAGAEKVKDSTRATWQDRFGLRILEGYGSTETGPVLSMNTAINHKPGTVGQLLPGIEHRLEDVPGITEGKRLWVRGGNVMLGYLMVDKPGELQPLADGWYDTGDIVIIDEDGFVKIVGRAKRFAKVAGEMVSLTGVEEFVSAVWPQAQHAVAARPHPVKGEEIVLLTELANADRGELISAARQRGMSELQVPKVILQIGRLPLLGSGKLDYVKIQSLVIEQQHTA